MLLVLIPRSSMLLLFPLFLFFLLLILLLIVGVRVELKEVISQVHLLAEM